MLGFLYNLIIMPIQLVVEMTYSLMSRFLDNEGLAIIAVSIVIQMLVLPLYKRSDLLQEKERERQKQMEHWVTHIKKTFKGDERFMMLNTYYRQQNYKPYYALSSSFSILLQIPFFIAAYNYLSHLQAIKGVSFLFIRDLGAPDRLFCIHGFYVNILPVAMTVINIVSGVIYTKGMPVKSKAQTFGLAAVFLVLLYNSPAGLVLYWTMNNVFSLLKNVFMKLVRLPKTPLSGMLEKRFADVRIDRKLFLAEQVFLTILLGVFIPMSVISASATEFIVDGASPMRLVFYTLSIYAGVFLVWFSIFYLLMAETVRKIFGAFLFGLIGVGMFDYMVYGSGLGRMSPMLVYEKLPIFSVSKKIINFCIVLVVFAVLYAVVRKASKICRQVLQIAFLCMLVMSVFSGVRVNRAMKTYRTNGGKLAGEELFSLSTNGENVVVFMLDRAISGYIPYIFEERPDIREQFSDFTYYPNTLTYGHCTNFATPALFGGYEYTPERLNARTEESLRDKHNEALKVLPAVFAENGYEVTVCDPPYANYEWVPDLSVYDGMEHVSAYRTEGAYRDKKMTSSDGMYKKLQKSNFVYYGLTKLAPLALQGPLYNVGMYCSTAGSPKNVLNEGFRNSYTALVSLKDMTGITEDAGGHFLMLQNSTTHEPVVLCMPDYTPSDEVDWEEELAKQPKRVVDGKELVIDSYETLSYYQINVAALSAVADWIAFLKMQGVYDNTRIIIVSDHGEGLGQFGYADDNVDIEAYNPLLLVKDFGVTGGGTSGDFMTVADVPSLAVKDVIASPVNPFSGQLITDAAKYEQPQRITTSSLWDTETNCGNVFDTSDGVWYEVRDNIFAPENWIPIY